MHILTTHQGGRKGGGGVGVEWNMDILREGQRQMETWTFGGDRTERFVLAGRQAGRAGHWGGTATAAGNIHGHGNIPGFQELKHSGLAAYSSIQKPSAS